MLFNSYVFIFAFMPVVLAGYLWFRRREQAVAARAFLLLSSLFFYGWWDVQYLALLVPSIIINFWLGRIIMRSREGGGAAFWLTLGVVFNLALIGYFKYFNFFIDGVNAASGTRLDFADIVLPLGISFFTFQQIAYLVDARRGKCEPTSLLTYATFVSFFPQLIAGPIVHHADLTPQLQTSPTREHLRRCFILGISIFAIGLFKKVVIADNLAPYVSIVFDELAPGAALNAVDAWIGILAYTFQIYFDFSGYSDMAIGLALCFGIRLPVNFASPYRSRNIIEFWRRWHITLSMFLRDYLYYPLGGNRKGRARRYANLMTTMLLGGLWHGAGWTFVCWGGLHGLYLCVNHGWNLLVERYSLHGNGWLDGWLATGVARAITLLAVMVAWVFFRALDFDAALGVLGGAFSPSFDPAGSTLLARDPYDALIGILFIAGAAAIALLAPNTQQIVGYTGVHDTADTTSAGAVATSFIRWRAQPGYALPVGILMAVALVALPQPSEFIYFNF